jgi:RNA polymerase sigma-70 factor (ECF subfamily)
MDNLPKSEKQIIKGCAAGIRTFQAELYNLYAPRLMAICCRYTKNKCEADDLFQDGFYQILKNIHQFTYSGSIEGWMRKIIINIAIQRYRSQSKLRLILPIQNIHFQIPDQRDMYSLLEAKEMINLVQHLPPSYRMVFNLYVFEGYKHREIAKILAISEGTSKSNLHDARIILQKALLAFAEAELKMIK